MTRVAIKCPEDALLGTLEDWDDAVFLAANEFTTYRRFQNMKKSFGNNFSHALADAYDDVTVLVYAVTPEGRSTCLVRSRWEHYAVLWLAKQEGIKKYGPMNWAAQAPRCV